MACISPTCIQRERERERAFPYFRLGKMLKMLCWINKSSRVKSTTQGKQFRMPNEKHSSELNENVRKNRCEMGEKKAATKKKVCSKNSWWKKL